MDGHCSFVVEDQDDDFEEVPGRVGSENEETVRRVVVAEIVDDELVVDGVSDVLVGASCRRAEEWNSTS